MPSAEKFPGFNFLGTKGGESGPGKTIMPPGRPPPVPEVQWCDAQYESEVQLTSQPICQILGWTLKIGVPMGKEDLWPVIRQQTLDRQAEFLNGKSAGPLKKTASASTSYFLW